MCRAKAEDVIAYPADLLIANIHYDVMRHLINAKGFLDKKRFILSGLMRSEAKDIADSLARHPVKILKQWTRDGIWHTFYGKMEQPDKPKITNSTLSHYIYKLLKFKFQRLKVRVK